MHCIVQFSSQYIAIFFTVSCSALHCTLYYCSTVNCSVQCNLQQTLASKQAKSKYCNIDKSSDLALDPLWDDSVINNNIVSTAESYNALMCPTKLSTSATEIKAIFYFLSNVNSSTLHTYKWLQYTDYCTACIVYCLYSTFYGSLLTVCATL